MIKTKLTDRFATTYPIISAPMAFAATGGLAEAVSKAGGLGLIGGGYGDLAWVRDQFCQADAAEVGCGFISWAIDSKPEVLEETLSLNPRAILLSFGNPEIHAKKVKAANVPLLCQVQTIEDARNALDCGADVVVAQGAEAGGHGDRRSTMSLVPEVADLISSQHPQALLCAAGGIADGRGLAAALMLGADGVLMGSRLWASKEANVSTGMHDAALNATGDLTIRTKVMDVVRGLDWPARYTARVLKNDFTHRWHDDLSGLAKASDTESPKWESAWKNGDPAQSNTFVGEATGLIDDIPHVDMILHNTVNQAMQLLGRRWT